MDRLIHWSLHHRPIVLALAVVLLFIGWRTALHLPVDVFPDLTAPTVTIMTEAPGMAPTEVESLVSFPIETALNGTTGVRRVRSSSIVGLSLVWVEFDWGTDPRQARQEVSEKISVLRSQLPADVQLPILAPASSLMGEIQFLALSSQLLPLVEVRTFADTILRRRLLAIPGVSQVSILGGDLKEYQVRVHPERLDAHQLTLADLAQAIEHDNAHVSAGTLNQRGSEWLVSGLGRYRSVADIAATPIPSHSHPPLLLGDLADIGPGVAPQRGAGSDMGHAAVIIGIQKQPGANTLDLTERIDNALEEIRARLPEGLNLRTDVFRQADFIGIAVRNVTRALIEGIVLVTLVILVFLANGRATLITLTAIPLSLLAAVLALAAFGATINTMTLGGMAIAVGALVDDAVIDVENVFRRLRQNRQLPPDLRRADLSVVLAASLEIRGSIVFATWVIALVFIPLFFLDGVEGRLLQPLGIAYLVALLASLIVALTVTPVLCSFLLPGSRAVQSHSETRLVQWLKRRYDPILCRVLDRPWSIGGPTLVALALALLATPFMGRAFLPEFNEGSLTITAVTLPGTSLPESDALGRAVERALLDLPQVASVARRTGRAELDEHVQEVSSSEIEVALHPGIPDRPQFLAELRTTLSTIPGLVYSVGQPISHRIDHLLSGTRASIAIKIFGPELPSLRRLADQVHDAIQDLPGVVDLAVEPQTEVPLLTVAFDRAALAQHGVSVQSVGQTLQAALRGLPVSRVLEPGNAVDLVLRLNAPEASHLDTLRHLSIPTSSGAPVPLESLARVQRNLGPNQIAREQVERKIVVQCNVADRDVTSVVHDMMPLVRQVLQDHPGYRVEFGGQFESAAAARRILTWVGLGTLAGIGLLLHLAFGSARDATLVLLNLPLALIGGVLGVFLAGGLLSVASIIGFITVFGVATRNGIMLVSHIRNLQRHEGVSDFRQAVRQGATERLVPILMTALATGLALVPLALAGDQPGNEIQTPMAIVILFGLGSSMILNMLVVPALFLRYAQPLSPSNP